MRTSLLSLLLLAACGGGGTTDKDASVVDSPKPVDSHVTVDGPGGDALVDAPPGDALGADAMIDAPAGPVLKVKNYLAWCSVKVNGGAASSLGEQDVAVTAGTIPVSAVALSGFELGPTPWHDTAGDTGAGDPGTVTGTGQAASSATTVVVGAGGKCVWVCCPFSPAGNGCPTADQCP